MRIATLFRTMVFLASLIFTQPAFCFIPNVQSMYDTLRIDSRLAGLKLALLHSEPTTSATHEPVLFIHGASFPSSLAAGFRMDGDSWMDFMNREGYETFALDFLGYGNSDRYPEMIQRNSSASPLGRAHEIVDDIDRAVDYILERTHAKQLSIIAHSWGGTVASLYATQHPEKIRSLVLFAALPAASALKETATEKLQAYESMTPDDRVSAMVRLAPDAEASPLEPEVSASWKKHWLASDPLASKNGDNVVTFPSGWAADVNDLQQGKSYFDLSQITTRTLLIRGEWDNFPSNEDAHRMFGQLTHTSDKKYVVIGRSTHVMHLEKNRRQLYREVASFLDLSVEQPRAIAVIFEVIPSSAGKQEYLDLAAKLKPELVKIDGFISIERFQSLSNPDKILSLSFWRDEQAVSQWRNTEMHRMAQAKGRQGVFTDYRLRVVRVIRDYGMYDRKEAPADSRKVHGSN
jgi:pimeloyl-ACP methyl ester carboxylesterase/heme-degrading monooxygenase HmoA